MSFTDYNQFEVGGVLQSVSTSSSNTALQDCDPALFFLIDFLQYVITTYPGPRLLQEMMACGLQTARGTTIATSLACVYPYEPTPEFLSDQGLSRFPALYVYRTQGSTEQWTVTQDHDLCGINVTFVLPPMKGAEAERCLPVLKAVYDAIRKKVSDGWDPGYTPPGGNLGDNFAGPAYANLEEIGFGTPSDKRVADVSTGFNYGHLEGMGNLWFPALMMRGYITERDNYAPTQGGPSKFAGADLTLNVKAEDGTVVPASGTTVTRASTQEAPTLDSLDVTSGPIAGGTTVNLTGALFLSGPPQVYFGPNSDPTYATSVTYNSSTSLTVVTPAMQGAGDVDVTVQNRDGQAVTLPLAFTFT